MTNIVKFFIVSAFLILFSGCSSKSIFKPENVAGKVEYDGKLPAKIKTTTKSGATLENGFFIDKSGLSKTPSPTGYTFLGSNDDWAVFADNNGSVKVKTRDGKDVATAAFDEPVVAAAYKDNLLAAVLADNSLIIYDDHKKQIVYKSKNDAALAINAKTVNPQFLNELVIFPTLDGKLSIVDGKELKSVKDIVVSSEKYFNNILFLGIIEDRLIAATESKIISINPKFVNFLDAAVTDVIFLKDGVYIFTKDGKIILTDADLKVLKEKKLSFARFAGAIYGKYIYAVEKEGYLIATDLGLATSNIFQLPHAIEQPIFTSEDSIYEGDSFFKLAK